MARFTKEYSPSMRDQFMRGEEARREAGRSFEGNRYVRCKQCKFTMTEAEAKEANIEACPQCGSTEAAEVLNLNYDPANERTSIVTLKQARRSAMADRPPKGVG